MYSLDEVKAMPLPVLELTDTQVCTLHATHGTSASTLISIALLAADHELVSHLHTGWHE